MIRSLHSAPPDPQWTPSARHPDSDHEVKRLRGVIFDYGNTLVCVDPRLGSLRTDYADVVARPGAERLRAFLARAGALLPSQEEPFVERFLEVRERNRRAAERERLEIPMLRSLRETLLGQKLTVLEEDDLERAVEEFFQAEIELIHAIPGAGELLLALRRSGIKIALLSNATSGRYVTRALRGFGWDGFFDPLLVSADLGIRKPHAEAFRAVLKHWDLEPGEIAMIGDSLYHDVGGAQAVGIQTVHFTAISATLDVTIADPPRPDFRVSTHEELRKLLLPDAD